ncbi:hypothetical protein GCM10023224_14440 [Streptomonospora halophila]|uniref:Uncharacterized protein n=1 Tax=Streptomonospora halophila TaxID=427369 RepID=A0ABP9GDS4_9ACTN
MSERLHRCVDELYEVFGRYPLAPEIDGCPHCVLPEAEAALRSAPLRRLSARALWPFAAKALTTWGGVNDLRHFLPRVLELVADGVWDLEIAVPKLRAAQWTTWPAEEQRCVGDFCQALWHHTLTHPPGERSVADLLPSLQELFADPRPFLSAWWENPAEPALHQLADLIRSVAASAPACRDEHVVSWICHPRTRESVEAGVLRAASPVVARSLSDAYEEVELLDRTRDG